MCGVSPDRRRGDRWGGWVSGGGSHQRGNGEQVGVVATLLKVHHDVQQGNLGAPTLRVQRVKVLGEDQLVVLPVWREERGGERGREGERGGERRAVQVQVFICHIQSHAQLTVTRLLGLLLPTVLRQYDKIQQ